MMTSIKLPYVEVKRNRQGKPTYWYFRRNGGRWPLPGEPLSEEFAAEYKRLMALTDAEATSVPGPIDKRTYGPGTFGALVAEYLRSAAYRAVKASTAAEYRRVLESLQHMHGDKRGNAAPPPRPAHAR
jgi:hypothetical protein